MHMHVFYVNQDSLRFPRPNWVSGSLHNPHILPAPEDRVSRNGLSQSQPTEIYPSATVFWHFRSYCSRCDGFTTT